MKRLWHLVWMAAITCACSSAPPQPIPGDTPPGDECTKPNECGCWECICEGIGGDPGAAQICKPDGHCPTGMEACSTVCSLADANVEKATPVESCGGIP